ncbi:MAG: peptidoglycan DD-metalloendopeptidase family protein [Candidatus Pacebacteria bacterium]|nr:peptidoglycan DD-metalloendopeptidase family protein [Candidatus Paceibacterota bacterium]
MQKKYVLPIFFIFLSLLGAFVVPKKTLALTTAEELQQKIDERNNLIAQLETEIAKYSSAVGKISAQAQTLKNAIALLDTSISKLEAEIKLTQNKISSTSLTIESLQNQITDKQKKIEHDQLAIKETLRQQEYSESTSLVETLLNNTNLSRFWDEVATLEKFRSEVRDAEISLAQEKKDLEDQQNQVSVKKKALVDYQSQLADQKKIIEGSKADKAKVLTQTKSQETAYKNIIGQKTAQKNAFEQELFDFESQLKIAIDPNSIPSTRPGVLSWPLAHIVITQLFGKTVDSKRLYASGTHSGVDFGTPIGTPVKAAMGGTVVGVGNSDLYRGCQSFGKWIMIAHPNGLSTLYGHLSLQKVIKGDVVATGQLIAYSGNTGYSTGPHLHFGVYATQGVKIEPYPAGSYCKGALLPIAAHEAYLDPLIYLPEEKP